jgi:small redox-active disulfide protein 2
MKDEKERFILQLRGRIKMKIEILGTGCPKCKQLEANAKRAVEESGKKIEVVKVTDIAEIIEYGVMSTPALVIDGEVKIYGQIATVEEIKKWL